MICIPGSLKIATGVQATLRFSLSNLNGCNIGITGKGVEGILKFSLCNLKAYNVDISDEKEF
jgi:hypothetical protein